MDRILVANRGEIAVRVIRAARELGLSTVAVSPRDDVGSLHTRLADQAQVLPGTGVAAYLDGAQILAAARATGAAAVHPGYGFLSENADFARRCGDEGVVFVGPTPEQLEVFGDKTRARGLAERLGVPVLPGTRGATTLEEARAFAAEHGPVMLKALAGGGGRGMRAVLSAGDLPEAYERSRSEAQQAFGNGDVYAERLVVSARHIEVQVVGDGSGAVQHLWERDCSIQRRHQKLIEVAPSPRLAAALRDQLLEAALRLAAAVRYEGLGTFEFLVEDDGFWFIEANPRLQVEHTVTEEVTGVDLVSTQIRLAGGATLADVGLASPPPVIGSAIQARVNLETLDPEGAPQPQSGTLSAFTPPSGPGVRVDSYGYTGYRTSPRYDSLLAKVIATGPDFPRALHRAQSALAEFQLEGVPSNIPLLQSLLQHPDVAAAHWDTAFVGHHLDELLADSTHRHVHLPRGGTAEAETAAPVAPEGATSVAAPMQGVVLTVDVADGDRVSAGARLMVLEAMKMEHVVRAGRGGRIRQVIVAIGDLVDDGSPLIFLEPDESESAAVAQVPDEAEEGWVAEVEEIRRRHEFARQMGGPAKVARQHGDGRLTVRERIDALADPGTFDEIGALTGFAEYDDDGAVRAILPANFVAGTARLDGRKVVLGADDFTVRGGSGDAAIHAKQIYAEQYAREMRLPMIRLLDGASGGGSVKMATEAGFTYIPVNPGWDAVVDNLSLVPVVAACLGPTVGLGAARLVMSHLAVMVEGVGQLFTAGPPVVRGGTGEDLTKEELGGAGVHRRSGAVERFVRTEEEAFGVVRAFLSYLPSSVFQTPPVIEAADPADRREERLLAAVPRDRRAPYPIDPILEAVFDAGSVFPYAEYGGATVTALARLAGHPVGVVTTDPFKGATMSVEGAQAVTRLVDLCETFHLPIVSLTDQAGMTIGSAAERRGTIRHGARAITAVYQARVPQAELVLRRVYGVGGAGIVNRHRGRPQLGLAVRRLGLTAPPGRHRGRLPRAVAGRAGPGAGAGTAARPARGRRFAVPDRRAFRCAGSDRPARQPRTVVRLGRRCLPAAPRTRRAPVLRDPAMTTLAPEETGMTEQDLAALLRAEGEIITARLDHWAATAGDRPFFHYGEDDVTLTYAEFGRRTDAIAGNLAARGVSRGDRISVFCSNPMVSALVMFGAWKAGALFCPVNFAYTGRLLSYQLNDTRPRLVVTEPTLLPTVNEVVGELAEHPTVVVYDAPPGAHDHTTERVAAALEELPWAELIADAEAPDVELQFDDPANIIYTSGTTGPAKGVVQPHRWMAQYTFNLRMPLTSDDVIYNDLPMYHVGGAIANVARAAWVGCEVAVWNRFSPSAFWDRVRSRRATAAILLDVMIPWLMQAPPSADDRRNPLNKVHMQPLPVHHQEVARRFGIDFVTAGFGQTESGAPLSVLLEETPEGEGTPTDVYTGRSHQEIRDLATRFDVPFLPGAEVTRKGLMGRPSPLVEAAVLNERDEECAPEEAGQLALRSRLPALFLREYHGKPEATVAAFRNLWFHTGDAAVRGADGLFYFVDRMGDRMRVRGENLSSFQVEDLLNQHTDIQFCAVFAIPSPEGDEDAVVAYVVPAEGRELSEEAVHAFAAETMPKHMRPKLVRVVDDIPRTLTNKIEKYKLKQLITAELAGQ